MALTNVVIRRADGKWYSISAERAAWEFPFGISVTEKRLKCKICGHYISFVNSKNKKPHFKHSRGDYDKKCDERSEYDEYNIWPYNILQNNYFFYNNGTNRFYYEKKENDNIGEKEIPVFIENNDNFDFSFKIGIRSIEESFILDDSYYVEIGTKNYDHYKRFYYYLYSERFSESGINYIDMGKSPSDYYYVKLYNSKSEFIDYWPTLIEGISEKGTIFSKTSKKKLYNNKDVVVGKEYYLVTTERLIIDYRDGIEKELIKNGPADNGKQWYYYLIYPKSYNDYAIEFFRKYNLRLRIEIIDPKIIWPEYIDCNDYLVVANSKVSFLLDSNNTYKFNSIEQKVQVINNQKGLLELACNEKRNELLSINSNNDVDMLTILNKSDQITNKPPILKVNDEDNNEIKSGTSYMLPINRTIYIDINADFSLVIEKNNTIINRIRVKSSDKAFCYDDLKYGYRYRIFVGLDCFFNLNFEKKNIKNNDDSNLYDKLVIQNGRIIKITHSIGGLANRLNDLPLVKEWFIKNVRKGYINERALKLLKRYIMNKKEW